MSIQQFRFEEVPGIEGLRIISPFTFEDSRGEFRKTYERNIFESEGIHIDFSEYDESLSKKGVLRGLHMQRTKPQSKLVRVIHGEVYDVAVDIRKDSKSYGKHFGIHLSAENRKQLFVPEGFLHGFLSLTDDTLFSYICGNDYLPEYDGGVRWDDPDINIDWPLDRIGDVVISDKDRNLPYLREYEKAQGLV
jgi:dTDP-4-dehydrorhamnose 3,5-epimerase